MKKLSLADLKGRVSWGSVFGGVMTVLAVSVLLSILNSSIGLFMFDPLAEHPASGIGAAVGIGSALILLISMIPVVSLQENWREWTELSTVFWYGPLH